MALSKQPDLSTNEIHLPENSWWPILLAGGIGLLPFGALGLIWKTFSGTTLIGIGAVITLLGISGWLHSMIRELRENINLEEEYRWLKQAVFLVLVSEAAIFGAFFAHHYYSRFHFDVWPPEGAPEIPLKLPAIATLLLMSSSFTMELSHKFLMKGKRLFSEIFLLSTILLGIVFLSMQAYEYGFLKQFDNFTLTSGTFGTSFYMMTGFHGLHVAIGLILLILVFGRMRLGQYSSNQHFSFLAASWYWHFVDVIWIFLFGTIYLLSAKITP